MEKYDLNGVRTPQDVIRRFDLKNIKVLMDDVEGITTEVSKKVGNDEIISKINQSAEEVSIKANKISLEGVITNNKGFAIDEQGNMTCNDAQMNNATMADVTITSGKLYLYSDDINKESAIDISDKDSRCDIHYSGASIMANVPPVEEDGGIVSYPAMIYWTAKDPDNDEYGGAVNFYDRGDIYLSVDSLNRWTSILGSLEATDIYYQNLYPQSLEEKKTNFEKFENGLDVVKNVDIYKFNYKNEKETDKKHIGFVIGDKFKYREEITSKKNDGADLYSMISVLWKAVQEQQKEIEELKKKVNK